MELINLENVQAVLEEYGQKVRNLYQDKLIENDRIASGDLLNSVEFNVERNGAEYSVTLTLADYWKYIEYGTEPHWPPVNKILEWIKIKPVIPRPGKNGKIPTPKGLAFLIGRKISRVGTEAGGELRDAIDEINEEYQGKLVIALHQDTEQIMKVLAGEIRGALEG